MIKVLTAIVLTSLVASPALAGKLGSGVRTQPPTSILGTSSQPCYKYGHGPCDQREQPACHPVNRFGNRATPPRPVCNGL